MATSLVQTSSDIHTRNLDRREELLPHRHQRAENGGQPPGLRRAWSQYVPVIESMRFDSHASSGVRARAVGRDGRLLDDFVISQTPGGDARQERPVPGGHVIAGPGQGTRRALRDERELKRGVRFSIAIAHWLCNVVISRRGW